MDNSAKIKELEEKIKALKEEDYKAREEARKAFRKEWRFDLIPTDKKEDHWLRIHDPEVVAYKLRGVILNSEEMKKAGFSDDDCRGGSMTYLFNRATNRIIKADGGGSLFVKGDSSFDKPEEKETGKLTFKLLSEFLEHLPQGGDVTGIIVNQKGFKW